MPTDRETHEGLPTTGFARHAYYEAEVEEVPYHNAASQKAGCHAARQVLAGHLPGRIAGLPFVGGGILQSPQVVLDERREASRFLYATLEMGLIFLGQVGSGERVFVHPIQVVRTARDNLPQPLGALRRFSKVSLG